MSDWAGGYIADIEYVQGFYPAQSPSRMVLACLLGGVEAALPPPDAPVHYLELGCGRGLNALVIAASNPGWRVTAIDYNPIHVAIGAAAARAAGIGNLRFLEADLATLAGSARAREVPEADFTSLHGVWTWVGPEVQHGIVRLLDEKVVPGGLVHVSYNAMPAWQSALGLQRLVIETGNRTAGRSDRQVGAGLALAREMLGTGAAYLADGSLAKQLLERTETMSPHYLAHEYMNRHWRPVFHADLCRALDGAKLDWVAAANPLENFPELMLSAEQRAVFERQDDPLMRELVKDMCVPRQFRQDVFVRGARRVPPARRDAALRALELVPIVSPADLSTEIRVPAGKAELGEALGRLMRRAAEGPATVGALLDTEPGRSNPAELVGVLVGSDQAQIAAGPPEAEAGTAAERLNRLIGAEAASAPQARGGVGALASTRLGTGLACSTLERFIAARLLAGERENRADQWAEVLAAGMERPEDRDTVRDLVLKAARERVPVLRALGIVPA